MTCSEHIEPCHPSSPSGPANASNQVELLDPGYPTGSLHFDSLTWKWTTPIDKGYHLPRSHAIHFHARQVSRGVQLVHELSMNVGLDLAKVLHRKLLGFGNIIWPPLRSRWATPDWRFCAVCIHFLASVPLKHQAEMLLNDAAR